MRIGCDVDGVLASFCPAYQDLIIEVTGRDLFEPGDRENPPTWFWAEYRGYTKEEVSRVWRHIENHEGFWSELKPLPGAETLSLMLDAILDHHDLYFITSRPTPNAKMHTESWLERHVGFVTGLGEYPTVLVANGKPGYAAKRRICEGLALDCYLDDNLDNAIAIAQTSQTRSYLLDTSYNRNGSGKFTRVKSVYEFLEAEIIDRKE